ncbi:hypothetical protein ACEPAH_9538 [Sanghuangporus vaninii]
MKRFLKTVQKGCKKLLKCVKRDRVGHSLRNLWARDFTTYLPWPWVDAQKNPGQWPLTPIAAPPSPRRQFAMETMPTIPASEDQVDAKPELQSVPSPKPSGKRVRSPTPPPGPLSPKQKKRILSATSTLASESDRFSESSSSDEGPEGKEKKKGLRYAVPESSPEPTLVQGTHPSGSLNEGGKSENPLPGSGPTSSSDQESLSLPKFKEALKWFRLVQQMVTRECMDDYVLKDFCPPQAVLFFIYHGWIELQDVMAWEHAREALGESLVINSKLPNGFQWLCDGSTPDSSGEPPTEDEIVTFLNGWQVSTDPTKMYSWQEDRYCRSKHGPFGRSVAIHATPTEQERVLQELQKCDLYTESIDLPDNLKRLFEPLLRRKRSSGIDAHSQSTFQPQTEARDYEERGGPLQPEESSANLDERVNKNRHETDSNDALDREFNNQSESTQVSWAEKGELKADATDVCWQPTSAPQAASHEAGPIPVQAYLQTEGAQEPVHSFGAPEMPTSVCQYPNFNASTAIGQQAPFQIHQSCDSYANAAAYLIGYQANSSCSYSPQDASMGFVPINGAGPAIISSGQQDDFEMSFGSNGASQAAQPSMPSTWSISGNLNANFFETGRQYVNTDVAPTWQSPLEPHAPSRAQSQLPWVAQAQVGSQVSFHQVPQTLVAQEESLRPQVPMTHRADSYVPQLTQLPTESPSHSPVHPLDLLTHDGQNSDETNQEKPRSILPGRRHNRRQNGNQPGLIRRRGAKHRKRSNNAPLSSESSELNGVHAAARQASVAVSALAETQRFPQAQPLTESQPEDSMTLD